MRKYFIGGVPEHFNLPWYLTLSNKEYQSRGINLRWKDFYGGTGQMCAALRSGEIDMAVVLTEGMVRDIHNGNDCKIVQVFVHSPLIWGIHVAANSDYNTIDSLKGKQAAISRYGSGSHLMPYVNARTQGWNTETDLDFVVVKNLDGALESLPKGLGDYFMWEKYTTQPYVDKGIFRRIGECPTPWPCFVIAVRNEMLEEHKDDVETILKIINNTTAKFKDLPDVDKMISERYQINIEDVRLWLSLTEWSQEQLSFKELDLVQQQLHELNLIEEIATPSALLYI